MYFLCFTFLYRQITYFAFGEYTRAYMFVTQTLIKQISISTFLMEEMVTVSGGRMLLHGSTSIRGP